METALHQIDITKCAQSPKLFLIEERTPSAVTGALVSGLTADRTVSCALKLIRSIPTKSAVEKPGFSLLKLIRHASHDAGRHMQHGHGTAKLDACFAFLQTTEVLDGASK
jgi:hypothetical protein